MNKLLVISLLLLAFLLLPTTAHQLQTVQAAALSIKLEQPKNPTNDNDFKINFVTLDTQNREVLVKCFKKGPNEADFSQFGSDINLAAGGGSDNCHITSSDMNTAGSYSFYTQSSTGSETATSSTVTVDYQTGSPSTPYNYSKENLSSCEYKIKFKTAADDGKTQKVEVYMSTLLSFPVDSGTKTGEVGIGSDQEGSFTKVVSDCDKTYYFAIRSFDNAGNGSGVVGDSIVTITTTAITKTVDISSSEPATLAIPVESSGVEEGSILGEEAEATNSGVVSGEESTSGGQFSSAQTTSSVGNLIPFSSDPDNMKDLALGFMPLFVVYLFYRYRRAKI